MPVFCINSKPAFNPAIEWLFTVPASICSGIELGAVFSKVLIPLPPTLRGEILTPFLIHIPPVP